MMDNKKLKEIETEGKRYRLVEIKKKKENKPMKPKKKSLGAQLFDFAKKAAKEGSKSAKGMVKATQKRNREREKQGYKFYTPGTVDPIYGNRQREEFDPIFGRKKTQ